MTTLLLRLTPGVPGVNSVSGLQRLRQHGEAAEGVGQGVDRAHGPRAQDVDLGIQEDVRTGEGILLPDEGVDQLDQGCQKVKFKLSLFQYSNMDILSCQTNLNGSCWCYV